jgi:hypothetical protein
MGETGTAGSSPTPPVETGLEQVVLLTAAPTSETLPDGTSVPMWGYSCGAAVAASGATCAKLNPAASGWSPVVITVPAGQDLEIELTNNLSFPVGSGTPTTTLPTSLVIVGQLGGGLGTPGGYTNPPDHTNAQANVTWPIVNNGGGTGTPPTQGQRVRSFSTEVAAGMTTDLIWKSLRPGTYLLESGTHPSIQGPMGLYGMVVVTTAPTTGTTPTPGTAYPGVNYSADVPLLLSEIDPVQNNAVSTAVNTPGFKEETVWSGLPGGCGNPASGAIYQTCYPPAVNYTPLYYMINGVAFSKTSASASLFPNPQATGVTGNVLVRLVNAGLRMHVPSIVGSLTGSPAVSGFGLIAEDGNPLPGVTRVQSEVFMAAGKTYDVMINAPAAGGTALPIFDRELSLSGNAIERDAGMLAYIGVNGGSISATGTGGVLNGAGAVAAAHPDTYNSVISGKTLTVSDPAKGVLANDVNVYGVKVVGAPVGGTVTLNANGTFTFAATAASGSFTYCGNGTTSGAACATVTLGAAPIEAATGITCTVPVPAYTSAVATTLSIKPPGVLSFCKDAAGYPLSVNGATSTTPVTATLSGGGSVTLDLNGGFTATAIATGSQTFSFTPQNAQGTPGSSTMVTLTFPTPSNLQVTVLDGMDKSVIGDYRWIIEEDRTFYIDPNCTTNPLPPNCPTTASGIVPTFGTNFHTSYMPVVAAGCTGTLSCEGGQSIGGSQVVCDVGNGV